MAEKDEGGDVVEVEEEGGGERWGLAGGTS